MNILLVEPDYYTKYPPLGLMKLASYHRSLSNQVKMVRGTNSNPNFNPDRIVITSLFTYAWKPVHDAIKYYHGLFPDVEIEVGGIYASIMPDNIRSKFSFVEIHEGLHEEAEHYPPSYDILAEVEKWKDWDSSIIFTSRGCIRSCPFCIVPEIEGKIRPIPTNVWNYIYPRHKKIVLWDNNFLASPEWKIAIKALQETGLKIDFNQGLDARLIDEEKARMLADLKMPILRMAYDWTGEKKDITKAVNLLEKYGVKRRNIIFYTLYNFYDSTKSNGDTPNEFLAKLKDIQKLGCVSYPMRFEPPTSLKKNEFISPLWTKEQLEATAKARRIIGYGGAFPPYKGLIDKFENAKDFNDAFSLRHRKAI